MIRYLIVDDEPIAHRIIEGYANDIDWLKKAGNCYNALEALSLLQKEQVDLIFLDINMPKLTGFDLLTSLQKSPKVIVTTAYKEHALEGYEFNVVDYLLKPFSFERFVKAVNRINDHSELRTASTETNPADEDSIFIKSDKEWRRIKFKDINYVAAYGNYCKLFLEGALLITPRKISDLQKDLPESGFIRIHKSYIVSKEKIRSIAGSKVLIAEEYLPVGETYKREVSELLPK